eukprot:GHVU01064996.1.p1 GENE.GHVU01064996.1~~GHVU01064996.1.p1  ORF type:complete len:301 (-),score=25.26 GHVU01064996.1:1218-2120(-)
MKLALLAAFAFLAGPQGSRAAPFRDQNLWTQGVVRRISFEDKSSDLTPAHTSCTTFPAGTEQEPCHENLPCQLIGKTAHSAAAKCNKKRVMFYGADRNNDTYCSVAGCPAWFGKAHVVYQKYSTDHTSVMGDSTTEFAAENALSKICPYTCTSSDGTFKRCVGKAGDCIDGHATGTGHLVENVRIWDAQDDGDVNVTSCPHCDRTTCTYLKSQMRRIDVNKCQSHNECRQICLYNKFYTCSSVWSDSSKYDKDVAACVKTQLTARGCRADSEDYRMCMSSGAPLMAFTAVLAGFAAAMLS